MALQVQYYLWQPRYNSSCAVISLFCDSHRRCVCVCVCLCASVCARYACVECVLSQNQYAAAQQQGQYNASRISSSCLCASSNGVYVIGARQIEPRQQLHVQCNNQTNTVGPHTRYAKIAAVAKTVAHTYHWDDYVAPPRLAKPPGYHINPIPKGNLVMRPANKIRGLIFTVQGTFRFVWYENTTQHTTKLCNLSVDYFLQTRERATATYSWHTDHLHSYQREAQSLSHIAFSGCTTKASRREREMASSMQGLEVSVTCAQTGYLDVLDLLRSSTR